MTDLMKGLKGISFAEWTLYGALFFVGIFHVYLSCALSVALLLRLFLISRKKGKLLIHWDLTFIFTLVLVSWYALSSLWAIDSGTAIFGFFKFLPLPLFLLLLMQEEGRGEEILSRLPYLVAVMTLISIGLMQIPVLQPYFAVAGRLSGFVQYPNTFACLLLVAELLLLTKEKPLFWDYVCIFILLFGILYTGSRTVFILAALSNVAALVFHRNKTVRRVTLILMGLAALLVLLYCLVTDRFDVLYRFVRITLNQSTFVGRLLYAQDALPVVLKNPLGIGYMGYYFIQQSIQTGVYSVMFLHNDFLQMLLDVGVVPFGFFVAVIGKTLFNKKVSFRYKLVLVTLLCHCAFDFDLQYVAIFMILLLFLNPGRGKEIQFKKSKIFFGTAAIVSIALCLYMGTAQALIRFELNEAANAVYPNTITDIELMKETDSPAEAEEIADRILKRNSFVAVTYSAKARAAYQKGDFAKVIEYKTKCLKVAPFSHAEYREYGSMLVNGIKLYRNAGDTASAEYCRKELLALIGVMEEQQEKVSYLGSKVDKQPHLFFTESLQKDVDAVLGEER